MTGDDSQGWRRWWRRADAGLAVVVAGLAAGDLIGGLARWPAFLARWSDSRAVESWRSWSIILVAYLVIRFASRNARRPDPAATTAVPQTGQDDQEQGGQ